MGDGSCASFSDRNVVRDWTFCAGGRDEAIISYAEGDKSSSEASSYQISKTVSMTRHARHEQHYLEGMLALVAYITHIASLTLVTATVFTRHSERMTRNKGSKTQNWTMKDLSERNQALSRPCVDEVQS